MNPDRMGASQLVQYRTNEEIMDAFQATKGLVALAAHRLGISRQTVYLRLKKSRELRQALADARELTVDVAEGKLLTAVQNGESWAIKFYLTTIGKSRGYNPDSLQKPAHEEADEGMVSRAAVLQLMGEMGRIVSERIDDPEVLDGIKEAWMGIRLD